MKTKGILSLMILTIIIVSCKKSSNNEINADPPTNNWIQISLPNNTYQAGWLWVANIGNNIYIGNESNSGSYYQFFVKYDINTNTFTDLPTNSEICACGYGSKLISDNVNLYYFANDGVKFSSNNQMWSNLSYPIIFRNGEAGCGLINGKIFYFGGRNFTRTIRYYDILTNSWDSISTLYYYRTNSSAVISFNNNLFVIGGNSEAEKKVSVFNPTTGALSKKNDCPYKTDENAVVFNDLVYIIGENESLYSYDPVNDLWGNKYSLPNNCDSYNSFLINYNSCLYLISTDYSNSSKLVIYKFK